MLLTQAPTKIENLLKEADTTLVQEILFVQMLPAFLCFFMASYLLPMTTQSLMEYPSCLFNEIIDLRTHDDIEKVLKMKPSDVLRQQLNGKFFEKS